MGACLRRVFIQFKAAAADPLLLVSFAVSAGLIFFAWSVNLTFAVEVMLVRIGPAEP